MAKTQEKVTHATSVKEEYYTVRFDSKEFHVKCTTKRRHHKEEEEPLELTIKQVPNSEDRDRIIRLLREHND